VGWWAPGGWDEPGCLVEGCQHAVGTDGCALDDPVLRRRSNVLLDRLVSMDFLDSMRATFSDDPWEFGREFLGWGQRPVDDVTDLAAWRRAADPGSIPEPRPVGLALAVSPGGESAAVVAAGRRADGLVHVELLEHQRGTSWLAPWLVGKQATVDVPVHYMAGKRTPEAAVVVELAAAGVRLEPVAESDFPAACDGMDRLVRAGGLRHLGDPRFTVALAAVTRRAVGDGGWVMSWRGSSGDASPARAMALAVRALVVSPSYDLLDSVV
jgi:hypothetical protein